GLSLPAQHRSQDDHDRSHEDQELQSARFVAVHGATLRRDADLGGDPGHARFVRVGGGRADDEGANGQIPDLSVRFTWIRGWLAPWVSEIIPPADPATVRLEYL